MSILDWNVIMMLSKWQFVEKNKFDSRIPLPLSYLKIQVVGYYAYEEEKTDRY